MNAKTLKDLSRRDRKLAALIKRVGPCELVCDARTTPYEALARAIVYQQLHAKAAASIFARVKALFPKCRRFPKPEAILAMPEKSLRSAGLSQAKMLAIKDLALKAKEGLVPTLKAIERMDNDSIIEQLTQIRGIGRWTVEMLLIFRLGRPDVLPVHDYGVRKGFSVAFRKKEMPSPKELEAYGQRWAPYRTTAAWYLWRAADLNKLKAKE